MTLLLSPYPLLRWRGREGEKYGTGFGVRIPAAAASRRLAAGVMALLWWWAAWGAAGAPSGERRPNFVVVLSDDQRADTIGAWGNPHIRTPNLDRLVRAGTSFTRAYIMGSARHGAVCVPSRAMLLSGRSLFHAPEDLLGVSTWPEALAAAGYQLFITGKWHNGVASLERIFDAGDTIFLGGMTDQNRLRVRDFGPDGRLRPERIMEQASSEAFADAAIRFLRARQGSAPFCLYVALTSPHDPRTPPAAFRAWYQDQALPVPDNFLPEHPFDFGELRVRDEKLLPWPRTPAAIRTELANYYGMISHADAQIGRILETARAIDQGGNTIVIFAGDNGLALGSHGLLGKQNLYEHSTRVPLIIAGPGIGRNQRASAFTYLFDLAPTISELAGISRGASHGRAGPTGRTRGEGDGRSLVPWLRGGSRPGRTSVFTAYRDLQRAVRDERWKLIHSAMLGRWQLFDLRRDPGEMHDLSARRAYGRQFNRLRKDLSDWQHALGDFLRPPVTVPPSRGPGEVPIARWVFAGARRELPGNFAWVTNNATTRSSAGVRSVPRPDGKAVMIQLQIEPPLPVRAETRLRFRGRLTGAAALTVQIFDVAVQDNRHIILRDLPQDQWFTRELNFTRESRRNDGTADTFAAGNRVDDLFFFVDQKGEGTPILELTEAVLLGAEAP